MSGSRLRTVLLAFVLPLSANLLLTLHLGQRLVSIVDQDVYLDQATNIAHGRGLVTSFDTLKGFTRAWEPTSFWGVGAQTFYAVPIALFGENYLILRLFNLALFAATLFYFRKICLLLCPTLLADMATAAVGLSPFFALFNQFFMTEMPFLFLEIAAIYYLFQSFRDQRTRFSLASGIFAGLSLVTRAVLLPVLPVVFAILWRLKGWKPATVFALGCAIAASPYCVRNSWNSHAIFLFGGKAQYNLWFFNSGAHHKPFFQEDFLNEPPIPDWTKVATEKNRADLVGKIGIRWIEQNPVKFLRLSLIKGFQFLNPFPKHTDSRALWFILGIYSSVIMLAFVLGLPKLELRNPAHVFLILLFFSYLVTDMFFMPASRHRMLYDPFFVLIGCFAFERWWPNETANRKPLSYSSEGEASSSLYNEGVRTPSNVLLRT